MFAGKGNPGDQLTRALAGTFRHDVFAIGLIYIAVLVGDPDLTVADLAMSAEEQRRKWVQPGENPPPRVASPRNSNTAGKYYKLLSERTNECGNWWSVDVEEASAVCAWSLDEAGGTGGETGTQSPPVYTYWRKDDPKSKPPTESDPEDAGSRLTFSRWKVPLIILAMLNRNPLVRPSIEMLK